jgi:hypothetical protein
VAFGARVSSGVQLAGSGAGAGGAGVAAAVAVLPAVPPAFVLVPGLGQPAARVRAASAVAPSRVATDEVVGLITVRVAV